METVKEEKAFFYEEGKEVVSHVFQAREKRQRRVAPHSLIQSFCE